jgi:nucleotide-binding universal stress UspA family protein
MNILVAISDAACAEAVSRILVGQIRREGTTLRLLTVLDPFPVALAEANGSREHPDFAQARRQQKERADGILQSTAARLREAGFTDVSATIEEGEPSSRILDDAYGWPADVIVLGARRPRGLWSRLIGGVSTEVTREAACAVEIVHLPENGEGMPPAPRLGG